MSEHEETPVDLPLVPLPGSNRQSAEAIARAAMPQVEGAEIEATVVLRRRPGADRFDPSVRLSREDFAARMGADARDVEVVTTTLGGLGLRVLSTDLPSRRLRIAGSAAVVSRVFGTQLEMVTSRATDGAEVQHRNRSGMLMVPAALDGIIIAVLGLDDRPQARTEFRIAEARAVAVSYTPLDLAEIYRFPPQFDGTGQTIAIIELGGGFAQSELDTYFAGLGITGPKVTAVGVDGARNVPGGDASGADGEVLLDIEVAGALSPGAHIVVYFAPNTDAGFVDAVSEATHAAVTPTTISISWGQNEDAWTAQARHALDQAFVDAASLGITVTAAAGDNGSSDGVNDGRDHADFPASSPHVLACGGTSLRAVSGTVTSETVWNNGAGAGATGGGVSDVFAVPSWQKTAGVPASSRGTVGRGVPDVAAVADPTTGYEVLVDGERKIYGGTSAVAPLWAALVARLAQATGGPFGLLHPRIYEIASSTQVLNAPEQKGPEQKGPKQKGSEPTGFRDITVGNNGSFTAGPGWDACTGLGVPDGEALLAALTLSDVTRFR